ncbi:MAG: DUF4192 domain-containing protein [Marmoricola sp.]|nr:DUF4192 domain-containing protein [Marmoricola sp.]
MTASKPPSYVARSPVDLIALVPVVLGFHPDDSVVLLTFGAPGASFHARVDLPVSPDEQQEVADALGRALAANRLERAALVLYTGDEQVCASMARRVLARLAWLGCEVVEVLRVDDGCWYRLPEDGSPGTPYDLQTHPFTARHVFEGRVVHGDRAELADTLVGTDEEDAVAVALAATRYADHVLATHEEPGVLGTEARWLRRCVRRQVRSTAALGAHDAGRVLVLASLQATRDVAWAEITRPRAAAHVELWRELVRRAPRELVPGPAALLAFAAWQAGHGALAWCAVDRALEVDPDCTLAHLVAQLLTSAVPPDLWEPPGDEDLPVLRPGPAPGRDGDRAS